MWDLILIVAYAGFSSVLWRLGGGAFTTLTGVVLGTDMARMFRVAIATLFVITLPPFWFVFGWAALFLGLIIGGWAPFQEMGLQPINMPEPSWLRWLPEQLGLKIGTLAHDFVGMAEAGFFVMLPLALLLAAHREFGGAAVMLAAGLGFAPAYLLARLNFPTIPNFAEGQGWGEVFAGALVGAASALVCFSGAAWSFS